MPDPMCFICDSIEKLKQRAVGPTSFSVNDVVVEENQGHWSTRNWIRIRSRSAEWSWLTPDEAVAVGRHLIERYGKPA